MNSHNNSHRSPPTCTRPTKIKHKHTNSNQHWQLSFFTHNLWWPITTTTTTVNYRPNIPEPWPKPLWQHDSKTTCITTSLSEEDLPKLASGLPPRTVLWFHDSTKSDRETSHYKHLPFSRHISLFQDSSVFFKTTFGLNLLWPKKDRVWFTRYHGTRLLCLSLSLLPKFYFKFHISSIQFTHTCPFQDITIVFLKTHWPFSRPLMV